jgi:hypothetical protein
MSFGFDPFAFFIAMAALWIAFSEARRNNRVVLKIILAECTGRSSVDENNWEFFQDLRIVIKNLGVPLHNLSLRLSFNEPSHHGLISVPLRRRLFSATREVDEFRRGMIAEYGFKTYEIRVQDRMLLRALKDPVKQEARLLVYSQGYLAKTFRIGGYSDRLKRKWGAFAHQLNYRFSEEVTRTKGRIMKTWSDNSTPALRLYSPVPTGVNLVRPMIEFIGAIASEDSPGKSSMTPEFRIKHENPEVQTVLPSVPTQLR